MTGRSRSTPISQRPPCALLNAGVTERSAPCRRDGKRAEPDFRRSPESSRAAATSSGSACPLTLTITSPALRPTRSASMPGHDTGDQNIGVLFPTGRADASVESRIGVTRVCSRSSVPYISDARALPAPAASFSRMSCHFGFATSFDLDDRVARLQTGFRRRRVGRHVADHGRTIGIGELRILDHEQTRQQIRRPEGCSLPGRRRR